MISKDKDFSSSNIKSFEKSSSSNVTSTRDSNTSNFPPEEFDQKQQLQQQSFSDKREWKSSNKLSSSSSFLSNWFFNSWFFNNWLGNWLFGGFFNWWNLKQDNEQGSSMMKKKSGGSSKFSSSLFNNSWYSYFYSWFSWQQLFWLSFGGGGALFFQYMLTGFFTLFTFIGIPFSYNCFRLALHGLKPTFEIDSRNSHTMWNRLLNTVWFFSLGWMFSFTNIFFALALGIFPFTRSFAQDHLRMLELNVAPFGKIMSFASTPWRTQQAENLTNLVQEEVLIVEQEQQEKLIPKSVSRDLDGIFDKYYRDSINISIGARQEFKAWIEKRVEKKMAFLNNALMKADDNVKQIREQVEQYVLSNVRQVRDDLEAVKSELQNVQAAHKKALEDVTMLQQEADRCQSFEQRFYESQEKNMSDVSNYEKRIDQLQANISQLNNNYKKGQDEFKQLKNQYGQLENEKNKWQADYDKLLIEFNGFKLKFAEQEKFKQERDSLELELKNFKHSFAEEKKKLQNDLSKLLTKTQHLEEELKVTRSALHTSQSEREKERETMKKMKEKFDLLSNLEEECNRLEQQVERDKEERNLLEREFKQNLATMEHKFQLENKEFIKWKEERNKIQEELNELRREKVNQDQLINDKNLLQKELSAIEANYKRLQEDLLLVSKSRDETEEKNRGLVKDLKHFEKLKLSMTNTTAATTTHSTSSFAQ